jgi:hypothetical protein
MPANGNEEGSGTGRSEKEPLFPKPSDLQQFATAFFSEAFPNPTHVGCPEEYIIVQSVQARTLPSSELRAHLFACSDCFAAYQRALENERPRTLPELRRRGVRPALAFLIAAIVIVLVVGIRVWQGLASHREVQLAVNRPAPAPPLPKSAPVTAGVEREEKAPSGIPISLDLDAYTISRSVPSDETATNAIQLPRGLLRLQLRLPEGRLPGLYTIRFLDEQEHAVKSARARSIDGQTLSFSLDTGALPKSMLRLSLEHAQQAPLDFSVIISSESK